MEYAASSESHIEVSDILTEIHGSFDEIIKRMIDESTLSSINISLFYVPIVMPPDLHERYKERSRFVLRYNRYECCPHLNYEIFLSGGFMAAVYEYARGLETAAPNLSRLGVSDFDIEEFRRVIENSKLLTLAGHQEV